MPTNSPSRRRGMSLTELLVVIAILGLLAVAVLPTLGGSADRGRTRNAALLVTSFISQAQARAIGSPTMRGFWVYAVNPQSTGALELDEAIVPDPYRGDTTDCRIQLVVTATSAGGRGLEIQAVGTPPCWSPEGEDLNRSGTLDDGEDLNGNGLLDLRVNNGDLIRFGNDPTFFAVRWVTVPVYPPRQDLFLMLRPDAGQSPTNVTLPMFRTALPFEVHLAPTRAGRVMPMGEGRVIDLRWSGYGPQKFFDADYNENVAIENSYPALISTNSPVKPTRFHAAGSNVAVLYDAAGRLRQCIQETPPTPQNQSPIANVLGEAGTVHFAPEGPVYFLIGRTDRLGNQPVRMNELTDDSVGANWQHGDSFWIAIDAKSGLVRSAPVSLQFTNRDRPSLYESQALIRDYQQPGASAP